MAKVVSQKTLNKKLSMDGKVQDAVKAVALRIKAKAESRLASHTGHNTWGTPGGHHVVYERIKSEKYGHIDHYVSLKGRAPVSVEFGHFDKRTKKFVRGLYIMTLAMR